MKLFEVIQLLWAERGRQCCFRVLSLIGKSNKEGEQRGNRRNEEEEEGARRPDLFMNAEIPRGSLGVPKHQRDCVPSRRYSITGLSEYTLIPVPPS